MNLRVWANLCVIFLIGNFLRVSLIFCDGRTAGGHVWPSFYAPEPPPLTPLTSLYLYILCRWTTMRNFELLAWKWLNYGYFSAWRPLLRPWTPPPLTPLTILYLCALSRWTTMQNFELLALKMSENDKIYILSRY